jgi:pimeloyl-ACP methyl ester carboxylesterase
MTAVQTADRTSIAYAESGDGPALVLVHGITESRHAWDPIIPALNDHWRVIAVDLRGHGESDRTPPYDPVTLASDVGAVAESLGLDAPLIVGHSLGGVVVTAYGGAGFPARAIVNIDQPIALGTFKDALEPLEPMLRGTREDFDTAIGIIFEVVDGPLPAPERARLDALSSREQDVVLGIWGVIFDTDPDTLDLLAADLAGGITVPYLSLHGNEPEENYPDWLRAVIPNAIVEVWAEQGHYPHLTEPDRFVRRLQTFDATGT